MQDQLTVRLTPAEVAALRRITTTLRDAGRQPYATRSDAVRFALRAAGRDPESFLEQSAQRRPGPAE